MTRKLVWTVAIVIALLVVAVALLVFINTPASVGP